MLTGDKGKTAKMIGVQCGMFTAKIKSDDAAENDDDIQTQMRSNRALTAKHTRLTQTVDDEGPPDTKEETILYEVGDQTQDINAEIKQILKLAAEIKANKQLELLIDGGVFA